MAQPIRKNIKEVHPDITEESTYTLLVDGNNLLRIAFQDTKVNTRGEHYGAIFQFLLQLRMMLQKKVYDYIYVVFDDEDSGILRYELYNDYKANREKRYEEHTDLSDYGKAVEEKLKSWRNKHSSKPVRAKSDAERLVDENFARERDTLLEYFNELYIRWIFNDKTEGDDIIAYYVKNKKPNDKVVIMSCDEDMTQLISDTVCVYNHRLKKYISKDNFKKIKGFPYENVLIKKIFCGDASDNIKNIKGVSEARLYELMPEMKARPVTINEIKDRAKEKIEERKKEKKKPLQWHVNIVDGVCNGNYDGDFYEINEKLINLSNPLLTEDAEEEIRDMMYAPQDPEGRSFENLYERICEDDITELRDSNRFSTFFEPFKEFIDKEIKYFKKQNK